MSIKQFKKITTKEAKKGAVYALYNAFQLYGDALIMDALKRTPRVFSLAKLAFEEGGKAIMLMELYYLKAQKIPNYEDTETFRKIVDGFNDHNAKTKYAINFLILKQTESISYRSGDIKENSPMHEELKRLEELLNRAENLDDKKNTSLYTSCFGDKFHPPEFKIDREEIQSFMYRIESLLIRVQQEVMIDNEDYYESIGLERSVKFMKITEEAVSMSKLIAESRLFNQGYKKKFPNRRV